MQTDITMTFTYPSFMKISKLHNKENALFLYFFYYKTAKYQHTNRPWATISFCAQGLGWSERRVREAKHSLMEIGLIKEIHASGQKGKAYIQIMFADGVGMFCEIEEEACPVENRKGKKKSIPKEQNACTVGFVGGNEIDSQMLNTRRTNAYDKKLNYTSKEVNDPSDRALEDDQPLEYNGLLCPKCKEPQFTCRSGDTCINGHGGMLGIERVKVLKKIKIKPKKIVKTPNPFEYTPDALKIMTHWEKRGGRVHKQAPGGSGVDNIKNCIEELLGKGLNTCCSKFTKDLIIQRRQWSVNEITSCIDLYADIQNKPIEKMYFTNFVKMTYHGNASRNYRNHSPLIDSFKNMPDEFEVKWQNLLRKKFKKIYPSVDINSTALLNCSKFLIDQDKIYKVSPRGASYGYHIRNVYVGYIRRLVTESGTHDPLKYMSGKDNLDDFITYSIKKSFLLEKRVKVA